LQVNSCRPIEMQEPDSSSSVQDPVKEETNGTEAKPPRQQAPSRPGRRQKARAELSAEEIAQRRQWNAERHAARVVKEERQLISESFFEGVVVQRARWHAWVKPLEPEAIPESVQQPLEEMNNGFRAKATDGKEFCGGISENVIYVAVGDLASPGLILKSGTKVKFKLYTDTRGVGGCEVTAA